MMEVDLRSVCVCCGSNGTDRVHFILEGKPLELNVELDICLVFPVQNP